MFRRIRILFLLLILVFLGLGTLLERFYITRWNRPVLLALYPINADGSSASAAYVAKLKSTDFATLETFLREEAQEYNVAVANPVTVTLAPVLLAHPPKPPNYDANVLQIVFWSLRLRWWAWWTPPDPPGPTPRIRLFLMYHDPAAHPVLDHSTGLSKGKLGIVNLFAATNAAGQNAVVIAHELLHTLGATDKYDLASTQPAYPTGYAEPDAAPRFPQRLAEIMGGRIPLSVSESRIPDSLAEVIVGATTAAEIGWVKE
jgi:hypothetical protein